MWIGKAQLMIIVVLKKAIMFVVARYRVHRRQSLDGSLKELL